ncbi:serine/arginine repetitive matrix protein 2 isoform X3 [Syngnathus scovelli]|uniref:serine/arginine repetitive matrix protein 2 isoform X3 n=1 Tax=Syngnathus scovelli TaxID=161590 RepID=UPI002110378F|nr:uncharacterized protein alms1 isoform X3 [Syngnathus scovelli]XP_049595609.1 uncharacterized protein alms1 isoform X3 [Syngnathus scovelli]
MSVPSRAAASKADKAGSSHKNEFQDSALSPALALFPTNTAEEASVTEDSLFQKSEAEFLPLSASLDFSARHDSDEGSLSQHPLAQETLTSEGESTLMQREADTVGAKVLYGELLSQSNTSTSQMSQSKTSAPGSERDGAETSCLGVHDAKPSSDLSLDSGVTADSKLGASTSVVSLEVDDYAPCWTSPSKQAELNIEDRIPLYLQNLGIDQSPADILTPFAPRGPIREPEFSPTDLSTIKDSAGGTPMKSVTSSEAGSPLRAEISQSSTLLSFSQDAFQEVPSLVGQTVTSSPPPTNIHQLAPGSHKDPRRDISGPRARSSLFVLRSPSCLEKPQESPAQPARVSSLTIVPPAVAIQDRFSPRRAEPEGCSAACQSPLAVRPSPAVDEQEPIALPAHPPDERDEALLPDDLEPLPEDSEDQSAMSDDSAQSSLTVRVAKLLRSGSQAEHISDQADPNHKKHFILSLSEGRFDSLELDQEDRRRIEEIKATMLSNHFVTSESSTDTESTAASSVAAARTPLLDLAGTWAPSFFTDAEQSVPQGRGRDGVKAHTSITIAAHKRPAASSPLPPEHLPPAQLDMRNGVDRKSPLAVDGSQNAIKAESSTGLEERDGKEEMSRKRHMAEDTTIPFAHVSRAHLTFSPKAPEAAPRAASSSSSSAELPGNKFVPLRRSSPAVSSTDEGVGPCSPPPKWDERRRQTSALHAPPPPHCHHLHPPAHSVTTNAMRSYSPETPVRDECAPRASAPALQPYKPRSADQLFFMPQADADASSSCTTMESSRTGFDDAVPPLFSPEVLGQQDPGLDRGVTIKHAEGIYSKRRNNARTTTQPPPQHPGGAVASNEGFPHASQRNSAMIECLRAGVGVPHEMDQSPLVPTCREAWLLEQLQRLSDLILSTGGADVPPARMFYGRTEAWPQRPRSACALCPADRDESSTTTSTLDTDRLIRAFGAHRIQSAKTSKSSGRLHKLYRDVAKQREQWEGRSFNTTHLETTGTDPSNVTGESSSTGSYAKTPQRKTSKKPVSRDIQAGEVEIACNNMLRRTRDVGTMFPPPGRARWSSQKGHMTPLKHKKTRTPPKAVWWFIPLDDSSKENEPDELQAVSPGPSTVWYDHAVAKTAREPLKPRQQLDDDNEVAHRASSTSDHQVTSLQEALAMRRPDFILHSRQRVQILSRRKISAGLPGSSMPRRAVPKKEMMQRTKQLCEGLPEVLCKLEMERRAAQLRLNRLNLEIFNKRINKRRLENRKTFQYEKLW